MAPSVRRRPLSSCPVEWKLRMNRDSFSPRSCGFTLQATVCCLKWKSSSGLDSQLCLAFQMYLFEISGAIRSEGVGISVWIFQQSEITGVFFRVQLSDKKLFIFGLGHHRVCMYLFIWRGRQGQLKFTQTFFFVIWGSPRLRGLYVVWGGFNIPTYIRRVLGVFSTHWGVYGCRSIQQLSGYFYARSLYIRGAFIFGFCDRVRGICFSVLENVFG